MKRLEIEAIFPKHNLSIPNKQHKKYPYLLRNVTLEYTNHVWSTDITYIKVNGAFVYLTAILDLFSRKVRIASSKSGSIKCSNPHFSPLVSRK